MQLCMWVVEPLLTSEIQKKSEIQRHCFIRLHYRNLFKLFLLEAQIEAKQA